MSPSPVRVLMKAIFAPFGDQAGVRSAAEFVVSRTTAGAVRVHHLDVELVPLRFEEKTIFVPSGDHTGEESTAEFVVSRCTFEPSAFIE